MTRMRYGDARWLVKTTNEAVKLLELQSNRFHAVPPSRAAARDLALAVKLRGLQTQYLNTISAELNTLEDIAEVNNYLDSFMDIEEAVFNGPVVNISSTPEATNIIADADLVSTEEEAIVAASVSEKVGKFKKIKAFFKDLDPADYIKEMGRYALVTASFLFYKQLGYGDFLRTLEAGDNLMVGDISTPCVLAVFPLLHVREIEVARSGKILKFRATGSVFLANQEGGEDAIRIEGHLYRQEVLLLLSYWLLFLIGQGKSKDIQTPDQIPFLSPGGLINIRKLNDVVQYNPDTTKPSYDFHNTFPLVTKHIIIPNVYIETMNFEERVIDGLGAIRYSLLLRTYRKPSGFELYRKSSIGFAAQKKKNLSFYKVIEAGTNLAWRMTNAQGYTVKEKSWRISTEVAGRDDVYYDISPTKLAARAATAMFGVAMTR